jgi:hypothetical protein
MSIKSIGEVIKQLKDTFSFIRENVFFIISSFFVILIIEIHKRRLVLWLLNILIH